MSEEQAWAWAALQVDGPGAMSKDELHVLARWLAALPPASDNELRPESELEAFNVLEFGKAVFHQGQPEACGRAARLAFEAFDRLDLKRRQFRTEALLIATNRAAFRFFAAPAEDCRSLREQVRNLTLRDAEDWPALVPELESLGRTLLQAGYDEDAVSLYRLLREVVDSTIRQRSAIHARVRENLALALLPFGRPEEIERLLRQSVNIREALGGEAATDLWRSWTGLALLRGDQLLFDEADAFAEAALQNAKAHANPRRYDVVWQCERLADKLRSRRVRRDHGGRLFGWTLDRIQGGPFTRSWRALVEVATLVRSDESSGTCSQLMENAARLLARAGAVDAAIELVGQRLQWSSLYQDDIVAGVGAEAVRFLLSEGRRGDASRAIETFFDFAASVDAADQDSAVMARRHLIADLLDLERPEIERLVRDVLPEEDMPLLDDLLPDMAQDVNDSIAGSALHPIQRPLAQPRTGPPSDSARALQEAELQAATAALKPAGDFYSDLVNAEQVAEAAKAANRPDAVEAALDFALARLPLAPAQGIIMHGGVAAMRFMTARRLGEAARRLLSTDRAMAFAERALAAASASSDVDAAGALVAAAGCACRPGPPR